LFYIYVNLFAIYKYKEISLLQIYTCITTCYLETHAYPAQNIFCLQSQQSKTYLQLTDQAIFKVKKRKVAEKGKK